MKLCCSSWADGHDHATGPGLGLACSTQRLVAETGEGECCHFQIKLMLINKYPSIVTHHSTNVNLFYPACAFDKKITNASQAECKSRPKRINAHTACSISYTAY